MRIEPTKPRYTIQQTAAGVTVAAPARRNWFVLLFLTVWLGGWTIGGMAAVAEVVRPGGHQTFLAFWLLGWLIGELYALAIVLWQLTGREELVFSSGNLIHRIRAGGMSRGREFSGAEIKHLRTSPQITSPWMDQSRWMPPVFGAGHGAIAFDYGAKTYRIGAGLDEAEGRLVLDEIRKHFPRMVDGAKSAT